MAWNGNLDVEIKVEVNDQIFIRDPEQTEVGRKILSMGIQMIDQMGLEEFTFRKLAQALNTNESSIYRYFESKHKLLLYLFQWYWRWMEYQLMVNLKNLSDPLQKIDVVVDLLLRGEDQLEIGHKTIDKRALHRVVIKEASKTYLTRHVLEDNQKKFFKPYKDFCGRVAQVISEYYPEYPFSRSLSSTVVEMSHYQAYFMNNLPSLTDFGDTKDENELRNFLRRLILSCRFDTQGIK